MRLRRRDLVAGVVVLALAALCVRLGFWQLHRLGERRARNAVIAAARALPPVELPVRDVTPDALRDRRAIASGIYDYAHERVWAGRTYEGVPGVSLMTPLRLSDGSAVFVDRGWAPSPDGMHVDHTRFREGDSVQVTGILLTLPRGRGDVDPDRLRDSLPYSILPIVIQLDESAGRVPGLARWPTPELNNGPHLSYAIQWFSFAVIIIVGTITLLRPRAARGQT